MTDQKEIQGIINQVKKKMDIESKMYNYLKSAGPFKILWLIVKSCFKRKFKLMPIFLNDEDFGIEVGLVATVDLSKFKQKQLSNI